MLAVATAQLLKGQLKIWRSLALALSISSSFLTMCSFYLTVHLYYHGTQTISICFGNISVASDRLVMQTELTRNGANI